MACGGHPLIVEACVSLGGQGRQSRAQRVRFANRIPLLFEGGSDVVTRCVQRLNWGSYKIDKNNDKIGVFVSIVSTKIPFKGTSKEYIGDDNVEIAEAVDRAIRACATQLKGKITRAQAAKERRARREGPVAVHSGLRQGDRAMLKSPRTLRSRRRSERGTAQR